MTRWASSTNETEAAKTSVIISILVDLDFPSGHVRCHDGIGTLTFGGNDYTGLGSFGGIDMDAEDESISAKGAKLSLSGIPADFVPAILSESAYQGREAIVYIGFLNPDTKAFVADPEILWQGFMDYMDVAFAENEANVVLYVEDELRREPKMSYYTNEEQQIRHAGDKFFIDVPNVMLYRASWGGGVQAFRNTNNPGSSPFRT